MLLIRLALTLLTVAISAQAQQAGKAAEVNGAPIMTSAVDADLGNNLAELQEKIFTLRQKQLDTMIDQKLLAMESAKRGVTIASLVQTEITSQVTPATSEDAEKFFKENSAKLKGEFKSLEEQIRNFLTAQRTQVRQQEFMKQLRAAAKIDVFLKKPPVFRSEVAVEGAPVRGEAAAPVTIVEFLDFHCPFCRKVEPVLNDLRAKYGPKIKIVYRDFPLDNLHPHARTAAEASHCAAEQGKFWEFYDRLFKGDPDASQAKLNQIAAEIGMNVPVFEACSNSSKYKTSVQASALEGTKLGVTGTPTFFINGRILTGAQPLDSFVRIIDEELEAALSRSSAPAPISIRPEPKPGQTIHVTTTQEFSMSLNGGPAASAPGPAQRMTETVLSFRQTNGRFDDRDRMESYLTIEGVAMKQSLNGIAKSPDNVGQFMGRTLTAVFDRGGKLVDLKMPPDLQQASILKQAVASAYGAMNFLPAGAMSVGDTQSAPSTMPLRLSGSSTPVPYQTRTVTMLRAVENNGSDRVAHLEQRIESASETDIIKVNGTGTINVNLDRGFVTASATEWSFAGGRATTNGAPAAQPGVTRGMMKVTVAAHE